MQTRYIIQQQRYTYWWETNFSFTIPFSGPRVTSRFKRTNFNLQYMQKTEMEVMKNEQQRGSQKLAFIVVC